LTGRIEEARAIYRKELKGYSDFAHATQTAAQVEFFARNFDEAADLYSKLYEQDPEGGGTFFGGLTYASVLGRIELERNRERGRELLARARASELQLADDGPEHPAPWYRLAAIDASLGMTSEALAHLQRAADAGWIDFRSVSLDPRFDTLRENSEFQAILAAMSKRVEQLRTSVLDSPQLATFGQ
jgi:tetratricopeptide (TPR) repeat protein